VVLGEDPTRVSTEEIPQCQVKMTVVGGRIVYNAL
jgi:predicted amidohydrolase YtcJ